MEKFFKYQKLNIQNPKKLKNILKIMNFQISKFIISFFHFHQLRGGNIYYYYSY